MELLLASLIRHELASGRFDPPRGDPFEEACFQEWLDASTWEMKVLAAAKAIGDALDSAPDWGLLTCFVWAEDQRHMSFGSSSDVQVGYALDQLIFYMLEANERHAVDVENMHSRQPPGEPQPNRAYEVARRATVDKAARWVCGTDDEEFEPGELVLRNALRRYQSQVGVTFAKRTLLRAWQREQQAAEEGSDEIALIEGYRNTGRIKRVAEVWEVWRSVNDKGDPEQSRVTSEYVPLFRLLGRSQ